MATEQKQQSTKEAHRMVGGSEMPPKRLLAFSNYVDYSLRARLNELSSDFIKIPDTLAGGWALLVLSCPE